jgi:pimeloyl-ACP methyl ester carboxylesterase/DNA-binding CsgD family transcriptional regulator
VVVPGFISNLDVLSEDPGYGHFVKRLQAFSRLILFDKRGTGVSDRVDPDRLPSLDQRVEDIRAVMDACGSGRAALLGTADGAALAIRFAALYPQRVRSLVLYGGYARFSSSVMEPRRIAPWIDAIGGEWGTGASLERLAPDRCDDRQAVEWWARFERLSASPLAAVSLATMTSTIDVRSDLARLEVPVMVLRRSDDPVVSEDAARELALQIPNARLVQVPGSDHPIWMGDVDRIADEISEFLTGERPVAASRRELAALLIAVLPGSSSFIHGRNNDEEIERFHGAVSRIVSQYGGHLDWPTPHRLVAWFTSASRATGAATRLRVLGDAHGLPLSQGIHAGEIDSDAAVPAGPVREITEQIAASARPGDIFLSRTASELVVGTGSRFTSLPPLNIDGAATPLPVVMLSSEQHLEPAARRTVRADLQLLSQREREVLLLIADGLSNPMIAIELGLSEHTVKRHVANILLKLDLPTRSAAAALIARQPMM